MISSQHLSSLSSTLSLGFSSSLFTNNFNSVNFGVIIVVSLHLRLRITEICRKHSVETNSHICKRFIRISVISALNFRYDAAVKKSLRIPSCHINAANIARIHCAERFEMAIFIDIVLDVEYACILSFDNRTQIPSSFSD
ncbi:hypothetical protein DERP_005192 [Dermatophagoides pteronyssinus]|uniref:Uncharacterized protein n=1 Tax=Dermatophagoides pteronyssinus TaxID=6956 RepID=A0ABQ8JMF6_DERPT|nr:hypothetical protein DERP_005192 [Dermatophagoides pteronyssinus]